MPKRRENMLEAFKASVDQDSAQELRQEQRLLRAGVPVPSAQASPAGRPPVPVHPGQPPAAGAGPGPGPGIGAGAGAATRPIRHPDPSLADLQGRRLQEEEGLTLPFGIWAFLGLQAVALGLAFFLGTLQGPGDPASGTSTNGGAARPFELDAPGGTRPGSPPSAGSPATAGVAGVGTARPDTTGAGTTGAAGTGADGSRAGTLGPAELSAADRAFADPANRFTVVVFAADDYPIGRERTWAMFEHLTAQGFAPVTPRVVRGRLVLLVGAAPRMGDLEALKLRVRELQGPDGRTRPFLDAWVNNIDNYK